MAIPGIDVQERPWGPRDTQVFGGRPAGVPPHISPMNGADAAAYNASPEGQATARAAAQQKFTDMGYGQRAGSGAARAAAGDAATAARAAATAAPSIAPVVAKPGLVSRALGAANVGAQRLSGAAGTALEGYNVAKVAADPNSSKIDVATQAAEGAGKLGATTAGAGLGAALGTAVFPGIGTALGGVAGGAAGYFGGDAAIHGLRNVFGVTEDSPIDRVGNDVSVIRALGRATDGKGFDGSAPAAPASPAVAAPAAAGVAPTVAQPAGPQMGPQDNPSPYLRGALTGGGSMVVDPSAPYDKNGGLRDNVIMRNGNSYSGGNVGPNAALMEQRPNGSTVLRDFGGGMVIDHRNGGGGAGAGGVGAGPSAPAQPAAVQAPTVLHSGNDWASRNALRSAEVSASSMTNQQGYGGLFTRRGVVGGLRGPTAATKAYEAAVDQDLKLRGAQPGVGLKAAEINADSANKRYAADQTLRGDMYRSDASLAGTLAQADASKRSAYYSALRDAQKQASEDVINQNDLDISNANRARDQFSIYDPATGKRDEAATNNAMLAVDKIIPGYSTMGEQSRKQHVGQATALADIYSRSRIGREQGFEQLVAGKKPALDKMPDFKGGTLKQNDLDGYLIPNATRGSWFVEMPDGRSMALGENLSADQVSAIRKNTETGAWK